MADDKIRIHFVTGEEAERMAAQLSALMAAQADAQLIEVIEQCRLILRSLQTERERLTRIISGHVGNMRSADDPHVRALRNERAEITDLISQYAGAFHDIDKLECGCIRLPSGKGYRVGAHGGEVTEGEHAH